MLAIYFNEYHELWDAKRNKMKYKHDPIKLILETYKYDVWFENEEFTDKEELNDQEESTDTTRKSDTKEFADWSDMPPRQGDVELKEGTRLKILTPNKLLTRLSILLAQINATN